MVTPSASSSAIIRWTRGVTLRLPTKTDEPSLRRVTSTSSAASGASFAISSPPRPSSAPRSMISTCGPSTSTIAGTTSVRGAWPIVIMPTLGFIGRHGSIGLHIAGEVTSMKATTQLLEHLYRTMVRIRRFDEKTTELFQAGLVKGTAHSYVGQEAVATGACAALGQKDAIVGNHRGHGHCIAKGARIDRMMAELMGRETGYCRGLGGSMHIAALDLNILGCHGIVAAGLPIGTGAALAARLK